MASVSRPVFVSGQRYGARVTINSDEGAFRDALHGTVGGNDAWDAVLARSDRRVRQHPAGSVTTAPAIANNGVHGGAVIAATSTSPWARRPPSSGSVSRRARAVTL
jgi:hypothetical protein